MIPPPCQLLALLAAAAVVARSAGLAAQDWLRELVRSEVAVAVHAAEARIASLEERVRLLVPDAASDQAPARRLKGWWLGSYPVPALFDVVDGTLNGSHEELWYLEGVARVLDRDRWKDGGRSLVRSAATGRLEEVLSTVEGNWSQGNSDLILVSAAFGFELLTPKYYYSNPFMLEMKGRHNERAALLRELFSRNKLSPSLELVDFLFMAALRNDKKGHPMLPLVAWGALRAAIMNSTEGDERLCRDLEEWSFGDFRYVRSSVKEGMGRTVKQAPHLLDYLHAHEEVLLEKTTDGETLLMEEARYEHGERCFWAIRERMQSAMLPTSGMNKNGETAAMLALLGGHAGRAVVLENDQREEDETAQLFSWNPVAKWHPIRSVIIAHLALVGTTLALLGCRPRDSSRRPFVAAWAFATRIGMLMSMNFVLKYGKHPWVLFRRFSNLQTVSWVGGINHNWPLSITLASGFLYFFAHDLCTSLPEPSLTENRGLKAAEEPGPVTATSIYEDPAASIFHCLQTFLISCIFTLLYLSKLAMPVPSTFFSRALWAASLFIQVYLATKSEWGAEDKDVRGSVCDTCRWVVRLHKSWNPGLWSALFQQGQLESGGRAAPRLAKVEVLLRFCMSYLANGLFEMITLYSLPHFLASAETPTDFVLNAFAVTFIYQLDDLDGEKQYHAVLRDEQEGSSSASSSDTEEGGV